MIRHSQPAATFACHTDQAHVEAAIEDCGAEKVTAGGYLYAVRKLPLLGQPLILRCSVGGAA